MGETTKIEWTDHTFNPWWGCMKVSPGCDNCYAERDAKRYAPGRVLWGPDSERRVFGDFHWNEPRRWDRLAGRDGSRLKVFCASMADVFDKEAPEDARDRLWALIRETPNLDWQILTKRIGNAKSMLPADWGNGYANVWLGASIVNQEEADRDIPKLQNTPARVRFLSCEPLLGPVRVDEIQRESPHEDYTYFDHPLEGKRSTKAGEYDVPRIDWVIAGFESGPKARPGHPDWVRALRDQCAKAGVPFLFKQWGEWEPMVDRDRDDPDWRADYGLTERQQDRYCILNVAGGRGFHGERVHMMKRVGKKAAGRELDGRTHDEYPA